MTQIKIIIMKDKPEANHDIGIFGAEFPKRRGMWGHHQRQEHAFLWETGHWNHPLNSPLSFSEYKEFTN